ncbi:LytTR family DNA-binding domain-containing protein [uncultured Aquimarina sp.]|uniref:LytR/AlgR family response regulator transcription factor n=1 Tax=uncultured Aquimarina sp. TaxID=575652 RepID=UPI002618FB4D|nr:LytTR family DNA-binding domain-containing protein [uncultured Aquimarina sp.]
MFIFFKKPHPFIFNAYSILIPSVITFLIIVVFAPFHFQEFGTPYRVISGLIVSVIVALVIVISVKTLKKLLPKVMSEHKWTIGKEFLLVLFVVIILILAISLTLFVLKPNTSFFSLILKTASITIALSIFPILISILFEQYKHQRIQLQKATALTKSLKSRNAKLFTNTKNEATSEQTVLIKSEKGEIELQLSPKDLVYVKSDGNYVEIFFWDSLQIQKKLIRNRLKNIETMLPSTIFFRSHNSFIVNGNYIIKIEGNARNLILHLKGIKETIPVSRAKVSIVSSFLNNLQ